MSDPTKTDWGYLAELLARQQPSALQTPTISDLARALQSPPPPAPVASAFQNLDWLNPSPPPTTFNPFGMPRPLQAPPSNAPLRHEAPQQRSTFYSFHYRDVFRVNHIRKAGVIRPHDKERLPTPQDRSLWEKRKTQSPGALVHMINRGLAGTTVTAVLAGYETWQREWVRYEIARSLLRGNGLLTVFIDGCECPNEGFAPRGRNPLSFVALGWNHRIYELDRWGNWVLYPKISQRVEAWPKWLARPDRGLVMPLDQSAAAYDWIDHNGREQLVHWTHAAALAAGR